MTEAQILAELNQIQGNSSASTDPRTLANGRRADATTLAHPMDSAGSVDIGIGDPGLAAEMSQQEQQRAAIIQRQAPVSSSSGGGGILGTLGSIFMPGISALAGLFSGGSTPKPGPQPYVMPPSVNFSGSLDAGTPGAQIGPDVDHTTTTDFDAGINSIVPAAAAMGPSPQLATANLTAPSTSSPIASSPANTPASFTAASFTAASQASRA